MSIDDEIELEHLLFFDRECRVCGKVKSLMDDFYLTRKNRKTLASSYSCLLYTSPSPRDGLLSRMPSSA